MYLRCFRNSGGFGGFFEKMFAFRQLAGHGLYRLEHRRGKKNHTTQEENQFSHIFSILIMEAEKQGTKDLGSFWAPQKGKTKPRGTSNRGVLNRSSLSNDNYFASSTAGAAVSAVLATGFLISCKRAALPESLVK